MKILSYIIFISILLVQALDAKVKSVNITAYNQDFGIVREIRTMEIPKGISEIEVSNVAEKIDPSSVKIKLSGTVLEQNYRYDLASFSTILDKYIDKEISLEKDGEISSGIVLSVSGRQIVLRKKDSSLLIIPNFKDYRLSAGELPAGLLTRPTLVWKVAADKTGTNDIELTYQTGGINWEARYVAVIKDDGTMAMNSWISLRNNSGATYKNAKLKLVAGDVNLVKKIRYKNGSELDDSPLEPQVMKPEFKEKGFFEYHLYDYNMPVTIADNEVKQLALFEADNIKFTKKYLLSIDIMEEKQPPVELVLELKNSKGNNLGMPFPEGDVSIFYEDEGKDELVGSCHIGHTPKNEIIRLSTGSVSDIYYEASEGKTEHISNDISEVTGDLIFYNNKNEDVTLDFEFPIAEGLDIISSNYDYEQISSSKVLFIIPLAKRSKTVLKLKIRLNRSIMKY